MGIAGRRKESVRNLDIVGSAEDQGGCMVGKDAVKYCTWGVLSELPKRESKTKTKRDVSVNDKYRQLFTEKGIKPIETSAPRGKIPVTNTPVVIKTKQVTNTPNDHTRKENT